MLTTLAAHEKCLVLHRDNLTVTIQMEFSQKQKPFSQFFAAINKYLKSPVSQDPSTSNMVNVPKRC